MSANKKQIQSIQNQFPELELTQSVVGDVLNAHNNNKSRAVQALHEMKHSLEYERSAKVRELQQMYNCLPSDIIMEVLASVNWDVDEAIIPLFMKMQEMGDGIATQLKEQRDLQMSKMPRPVEETSQRSVERELQTAIKDNPFSTEAMQVATSVLQPASAPEKMRLVASPAIIDSGNKITVEWEALGEVTTSAYDWVGLFLVGQPNKSYLTYEWRGANDKKGTVSFVAPSAFGEYEFRYIPYGSYQHSAISNRVRVGPHIILTTSFDKEAKKVSAKWDIKNSNDYSRAWVGLYEKKEQSNKNYIAWQYATKPYTEVAFEAPIKPGEYEFRYFPFAYVDVSRSSTITIEGTDTVEAVLGPNNTIDCKVSIVTLDPYYDRVWIGLYNTSEQNNRNLKRYKYITERETQISFRAPDPGLYELRLFAQKSYELVLKSNSVEIQP